MSDYLKWGVGPQLSIGISQLPVTITDTWHNQLKERHMALEVSDSSFGAYVEEAHLNSSPHWLEVKEKEGAGSYSAPYGHAWDFREAPLVKDSHCLLKVTQAAGQAFIRFTLVHVLEVICTLVCILEILQWQFIRLHPQTMSFKLYLRTQGPSMMLKSFQGWKRGARDTRDFTFWDIQTPLLFVSSRVQP